MTDTNNTSRRHGDDLTLGAFLSQARVQAGLSRRQLERLSGVGRMNITRLETDWYQQPPADDLVRLARALELNDTDLFLLAGLPVPAQGASLEVMLRKGYGVADHDVPELTREIEALIAHHHPQATKKGGNTNEPTT